MKKFSERSKTGQRRIVIVFGGFVCVMVLAAILIFDKSGLGAVNSFVDGIHGTMPTLTPVNGPTPYVKPTSFPDVTEGALPDVTQKPEPYRAEEVLSGFLHYVLNEEFPYDGTVVSEDSLLNLAGIDRLGERISVEEVTPGDVGLFGDVICVCIGHDERGLALFAYAAPYCTEVLKNGGIYFGYSMEQMDALYCGMYPVPCETYYDCAEGAYTNISLTEKSDKAKTGMLSAYSEELYRFGREVSSMSCDAVMNAFPEELLKEYGLTYDFSFLYSFLTKFNVRAGAEDAGTEYSFIQNGSAYRLSNKAHCMDVRLISLGTENYLSEYGRWTLELTKEYGMRLIPSFLLSDYAGTAFSKAGAEEKQETVVKNEDGSQSYHGNSYQVTAGKGAEFVEPVQGSTYFDLGNMKYLLVTASGASFEYDLSEYVQFPEELIEAMILNKLEELNGSEGVE